MLDVGRRMHLLLLMHCQSAVQNCINNWTGILIEQM